MDPKIEEAKKTLKIADHMIYVTYPVIREGRILIKALDEIGKTINLCIDFILRGKKHIDSKTRFEDFLKASKEYGLSENQTNKLSNILEFIERRRKSPMEFSRKDKAVIMHWDLNTENVTVEMLKENINYAKEFLEKVEIIEKNP
ncbi:MAG: hypothetical protein KKE23_02050 [Nanoarchaeota archaeon]|nr:hypothetical protein [Nanoarchaeota archaeon]